MFGIIRPCRHRLSPELRSAWLGHLCGLGCDGADCCDCCSGCDCPA